MVESYTNNTLLGSMALLVHLDLVLNLVKG